MNPQKKSAITQEKADAFVGQVVNDIAAKPGTSKRYVLEWLNNQVDIGGHGALGIVLARNDPDSTFMGFDYPFCTPNSLSQEVGQALGGQAGEGWFGASCFRSVSVNSERLRKYPST